MKNNRSSSGFSLVELSIVLVILGLLVGGILGGQSLIRAAELRSVTTEYDQWRTAINTFRMKYFAYPGDMNNAIRFWGDAGVCDNVEDDSHTEALDGTCNGNGNGVVFSTGNDRYEIYLFWQHLQLAGLISGNYTGVPAAPLGAGWEVRTQRGANVPASKLSPAIWYAAYHYIWNDASGNLFERDYTNALVLESLASTWGNLLPPEEAWGIDTKLDDGMPATGIIISNRSNGNCTNGTNRTDYEALYQLDETDTVCSLYFLQPR